MPEEYIIIMYPRDRRRYLKNTEALQIQEPGYRIGGLSSNDEGKGKQYHT